MPEPSLANHEKILHMSGEICRHLQDNVTEACYALVLCYNYGNIYLLVNIQLQARLTVALDYITSNEFDQRLKSDLTFSLRNIRHPSPEKQKDLIRSHHALMTTILVNKMTGVYPAAF
jgi:hypothetical protein